MYWSFKLHDWYCHGDCGSLAFAINELTGWPVVISYNWPCVIELCPKSHDGGPHMLVRHPSGKLLDIDGLHEESKAGLGGVMTLDEAEENGVDIGAWRSSSFYDLAPSQVTADALALIASVGFTGLARSRQAPCRSSSRTRCW